MIILIMLAIFVLAIVVTIVTKGVDILCRISIVTAIVSLTILFSLMIFGAAHQNPKVSTGKSVISEESQIEGAPDRSALVENFEEDCTFWDCSANKSYKFLKYVDLKELEK